MEAGLGTAVALARMNQRVDERPRASLESDPIRLTESKEVMGIENPVHLMFLAAVALIVLGPKRLPELARAAGKGMREFRESLNGEGAAEEPPAATGTVVQAAAVAQAAAVQSPSPQLQSPQLQSPQLPAAAQSGAQDGEAAIVDPPDTA
jgi:sec-independent protein translocase protein TatA